LILKAGGLWHRATVVSFNSVHKTNEHPVALPGAFFLVSPPGGQPSASDALAAGNRLAAISKTCEKTAIFSGSR
jgi:hypothetical protein